MRFLWVNLQLQQLCRTSRGQDDQELRQALDYLPQGLAAMYTRILDEIAGGDERVRKIPLECFRWMMYAKEPISLDDLRVAVTLLKSPITAQELMSRLTPGDYIVEECRNLIRLSKSGRFDERVDPIHFSFLEYLQDLPLEKLQGGFWNPLTDIRDSESVLACRCIDWLMLALPNNWEHSEIWATYTHLSYPTKFFDKHAVDAISGSCKAPADILGGINRLLTADMGKLAYLVRLRLMRMPLGRSSEGQEFDEALSRNYLLWTSDLYLIPGLNSAWKGLEVPKHALHLAVWSRPDELQKLLSNGHDVDELDGCQKSPLSYACTKGCLATVEALLRAGAKIDASSWQNSPLGLAIRKDHLEIAKALLKANANVCFQPDIEGRFPLMMAASLEMVQLLCDVHNADIHATDRSGRSVLGHHVGNTPLDVYVDSIQRTRILDYLINRGADMSATSKANMSLIDYAVSGTYGIESLRYLLQRDPRLVEKAAHQWTSLHWACKGTFPRSAETLLRHGSKAKKVTTVQPPRSWTPYEILKHYHQNYSWFDKSTIDALGGPEEIRADIDLLPEEHINYDSLTAKTYPTHLLCSLCAMQVEVCDKALYFHPLLILRTPHANSQKTGLLFECETCGNQTCLMCNHTLHSDQPDHVFKSRYIFRTGTVQVDPMRA
jgi:hypothetical protein